jgi:hypothetical protein
MVEVGRVDDDLPDRAGGKGRRAAGQQRPAVAAVRDLVDAETGLGVAEAFGSPVPA